MKYAEIACVMGNDLIEFLDIADEGVPPGYNPGSINVIIDFEQTTSGSKVTVPILLLLSLAEFERQYSKARRGRIAHKLVDGFEIITELSLSIRKLQSGKLVAEETFSKQAEDAVGYALAALRAHDEELFATAIQFEPGVVLYTHVLMVTGDEGVENEHFCSQAWSPNGSDEAEESLYPGSTMVH